MTTLSWVPRISTSLVLSATPTITASSAYVSGYRFGSIMTLAGAVRNDPNIGFGSCILQSIHIQDKDAQSAAFDIWFFNALPTIASADHAAFDLTDANMALSIGAVSIGSSYSASTSNSVSLGDGALNKVLNIVSGSSIYAVAIVRGTPTYTTTTSVTFQFGFLVD